jgi:cholesterol transport system auxiliary component
MRKIQFVLQLLLVLFIATACVMSPKQPALHDFGVAVSSTTQNYKQDITVDAPTWLWDNRIRYRLLYATSTRVGFYALDQWLASPPELFQQQLIASGKIPAFPLVIQLLDFEQQFDASDKARVVLRFTVDAFSPGNKGKLGTQEFHLQQATETPDAAGAVKGFRNLVQQADEQIYAWVLSLPKEP